MLEGGKFLTHSLTLYLLRKIQAQRYMSEIDYENTTYALEILLINLFKSVQVYAVAFVFGVLFETFLMNLAYVFLRIPAGGWHAKSSRNCSIFGLVVFVGIPVFLKYSLFTFSFNWLLLLSSIVLLIVFLYAPSDTEKNPLVSMSERKKKKRKALFSAFLVVCLSLFFVAAKTSTLLITGLVIESLLIHPFFYKLTKRSYKNFENYQTEQ
jgi:accessory gene regulator B